jgi:chorismate mutase / prephenate dehydratase
MAGSENAKSTAGDTSSLMHLDRQLIDLLNRRVELVRRIGPLIAPTVTQWHTLLDKFAGNEPLIIDWLKHAASLSERLANPEQSIAYLGPMYSFSYLAAARYFGMGAHLVPVNTISAAFEEVQRKQASFAVVPVENNTDGRVVDSLGMFAKTPVQICGEILLPIHHCLLGRADRNEIREVHSKPQALSQCRHWLATHLPNVKLVEVASTAEAATTAANSESVAAIASREAGIHYGCKVIAENIEDNTQNITRFAVIGDRLCPPTGNDKTSMMFQLSHQPGALADAMIVFKQAGVNLTWIESFPLPNRPNEYLFFIELDGHMESEQVKLSIAQLRSHAVRLDVLGSYPKGQVG